MSKNKKVKRSKTIRNITYVYDRNKIKINELDNVDNLLSNLDIKKVNENTFLIDSTVNNKSKKTKLKLFDTDKTRNFNNKNTDKINKHEPESSFIAEAANEFFDLDDNIEDGLSKLRFLARADEYCDDQNDIGADTNFEITSSRSEVILPTPVIESDNLVYNAITEKNEPIIKDNILLTYGDIKNKNIKQRVGLPKKSEISLYNKETNKNDQSKNITPFLNIFMNNNNFTNNIQKNEKLSKPFEQYLESNTFNFDAGKRYSNIVLVNQKNAALYTLFGVLSVKPNNNYKDLEHVTLYIETPTQKVNDLSSAENLKDNEWFIVKSKTIQFYAYGMPLSMSAFLHRNSFIRLRVNLDSTMGSMNHILIRKLGSFTNQYSNTFYGFSGTI